MAKVISLVFIFIPFNLFSYTVTKFSSTHTPYLSHFTDVPTRFRAGNLSFFLVHTYAEGLAKYKYSSPPLNRILPGVNILDFNMFVECTSLVGIYAGFPLIFGNLNSYKDESTAMFSTGDIRLGLLFAPFVSRKAGVMFNTEGVIPLGREKFLLRSPLKGGIEVIGAYYPYPMKFILGAGYYLSEEGELYKVRYGDEIKLEGEVVFSQGGIIVSSGLKTITPLRAFFSDESTYIEALFGFGWNISGKYIISAITGVGLTENPGTPKYRLGFVFTYLRSIEMDSDGDGIPDKFDDCKMEPEDKDGIFDLDGCPEEDGDLDGIPDEADLCPFLPEDINGITDDDGCPELRGSSGRLKVRYSVILAINPAYPDKVWINGRWFSFSGRVRGVYVNGRKILTSGKKVLFFNKYKDIEKISLSVQVEDGYVKVPLRFPKAVVKSVEVLSRKWKRVSRGIELKEIETKWIEVKLYGEEGVKYTLQGSPMKVKEDVWKGKVYVEGSDISIVVKGKRKNDVMLLMEIMVEE